jgi:hypothetical protein
MADAILELDRLTKRFGRTVTGEQLTCAGFLRRVLKAAGGLERLSAQWERRGRRRPLLSLSRAATAIVAVVQ